MVREYLTYRRALGFRLVTDAYYLQVFSHTFERTPLSRLHADRVLDFLYQGSQNQPTIARKHRALTGLYRYMRARYGDVLPELPPLHRSQSDPEFVPFIYSHQEIKRLLQATSQVCHHPQVVLEAVTLRATLLLLYGAGLRLGEALALTNADVDLKDSVLTIRQSKFYKSRYVPVGRDLNKVLTAYRRERDRRHDRDPDSPFICLRNGKRAYRGTVQYRFRRLRAVARVTRRGGPRCQPRLHDLRHTAAVHRLIQWYRSGADLQSLLPRLVTFLGHKSLSGTQRYLTLTPQLMREASQRFQRYAFKERHD